MAGFLDGLLSADPAQAAKMADVYGLPPEFVQQTLNQNRGQVLGQIGGALLEAAAGGVPLGSRAQALAKLGQIQSDPSGQLLNAQQARIQNMTLKMKQQEWEQSQSDRAKREAAIKQLEAYPDLPDALRSMAALYPDKVLEMILAEEERQKEAARFNQQYDQIQRPQPAERLPGVAGPVAPGQAGPSLLNPGAAGVAVRAPQPAPNALGLDPALIAAARAAKVDPGKLIEESLLRGRPKEPTADIQNYQFYLQQEIANGRQPDSYEVWRLKAARNSTAPQTPNEALMIQLAKDEGTRWSKLQEAGVKASALSSQFPLIDELLKSAPQGPLVGRLAQAFPGFSNAGAALQSRLMEIAPSLRVEGSGATSDIEYNGMLASLPQLINNPEANSLIAQVMKAKSDINIRRAEIVTLAQNGDISPEQARRELDALNRASIMTPEVRDALGIAVGKEPGTSDVPPMPPSFDGTPDEWNFMTPEERRLFQ
jgi:hypothetical protein